MSKMLFDYDYIFPSEQVAQQPLADRNASRMMVLSPRQQSWQHAQFCNLPEFLQAGDLLIANDTSVLACRLFVQKVSGGKAEVFLLKPMGDLEWSVFLSPTRGLKEGMRLPLFSRKQNAKLSLELTITSLKLDDFRIRFDTSTDETYALTEHGEMPLPPYIERQSAAEIDRTRYQTVFAKNPGAVAAPTAGLHFTEAMKQALHAKGIDWATVTLHVGAGTFLPVKTEKIDEHPMHYEHYEIFSATLEAIRHCHERGGRVFAIGTTSLRALETWAATGQTLGETNLFIRPGFQFKVIDGLLTNFHQPKSTLLMLVSALAGREFILSAYREAIDVGYRLFSYGDCMLIRG